MNGNKDCFAEEGIIVDKIRSLLRMNSFQGISQ